LDVERFFNFSGEPAETPLTKLPHWNAWQVVEEFDESEVPGWPQTIEECFELTERGQMVPSRAGLVANMKWVEGGDVDPVLAPNILPSMFRRNRPRLVHMDNGAVPGVRVDSHWSLIPIDHPCLRRMNAIVQIHGGSSRWQT
jgi:hypothetical protein